MRRCRMDRGIRRRLDVLIVLCSWLLGIALTYLFFSQQTGPMFLLFTLFPAVLISLLGAWYVQ